MVVIGVQVAVTCRVTMSCKQSPWWQAAILENMVISVCCVLCQKLWAWGLHLEEFGDKRRPGGDVESAFRVERSKKKSFVESTEAGSSWAWTVGPGSPSSVFSIFIFLKMFFT